MHRGQTASQPEPRDEDDDEGRDRCGPLHVQRDDPDVSQSHELRKMTTMTKIRFRPDGEREIGQINRC